MTETISEKTQGAAGESQLWEAATQNAIRRLVRCVFAEKLLDAKALLWAENGDQAWLPLWVSRRVLHFTRLQHAPADTLLNRGVIEVIEENGVRRRLDDPAALLKEIAPALNISSAPDGFEVLLRDVEDSMKNDVLARGYREEWSVELRHAIAGSGAGGFIDHLEKSQPTHLVAMALDQWGSLEGHPFYPTWKAKPGLSAEEISALSPEFGARVPLRIAALRRDWAYVEAMSHVTDYSEWFANAFTDVWEQWSDGLLSRGRKVSDWLPMPIHGWHLENFVRREFASQIASGILDVDGPDIVTIPAMSFRTMLPDTPEPQPFIKLPVAIWMTSEQRTLQAKSIHMGPRLSTLISDILANEDLLKGSLEIFTEELGAILHDPETGDEHPGRFLSVVYREVNALARKDGLIPVTVAALLAESPLVQRPLVCELIARNSAVEKERAPAFFRAYARTVIRPTLAMYLLYGIAFEAHQQNSTILFDTSGNPQKLLIRDFGDGRSFAPLFEERGYRLTPFSRKGILPTTFNDDISLVRSFVIDACFVCHLHEMALCLAEHCTIDDPWQILREETQAAFDLLRPRMLSDAFWAEERQAFLEKPWPTRSVLRMHLERYRDYRVEHQLDNPLAAAK